MKHLFALLAVVFLSACAGSARDSVPLAVYDFGMPVARLPGVGPGLALDVKSAHAADSTRIEYRLAYEDPLKLRHYAASQWAASPVLLLEQHLRQQMGLVGATSNTAVDCLLRIDLQAFSQIFDTPQLSRGLVQGSATLLDARRRQIGERLFAIEQPAPGNDARGGVSALVAASGMLAQQLHSWLDGLEKSGSLKTCRSLVAG